MKKLFKVEVTVTMLIAAVDEKTALGEAEYILSGADGVSCDYDLPLQITDPSEIPADWRGAIAFDSDDDMTCEEVLEAASNV